MLFPSGPSLKHHVTDIEAISVLRTHDSSRIPSQGPLGLSTFASLEVSWSWTLPIGSHRNRVAAGDSNPDSYL